MANYPLEWGWQTDPKNDTDKSAKPDLSPATRQRYPLEWGWDTPSEPDPTAAPEFVPVRQTLLGGADPNTIFAAGKPLATSAEPAVMSDAVAEPLSDGQQIAQAEPPAQSPTSMAPGKNAQPATGMAVDAREQLSKIDQAELARRLREWDDIVRGQPDVRTQKLLPDDWQTTFNPDYVKWVREAAARTGVPVELLARHIWKESTFNPNAEKITKYGTYRGMGQLGPAAIEHIGLNPKTFQYFDAKSSIDATAAYLALMYKETGSWPAAVAAYNAGAGNINPWLSGRRTGYWPNPETQQAIRHVFRGNPKAFDK